MVVAADRGEKSDQTLRSQPTNSRTRYGGLTNSPWRPHELAAEVSRTRYGGLTNSLRRSGLSTAILSSPLVPPLALRYLDFLRALIQGIVGVLRFLLQLRVLVAVMCSLLVSSLLVSSHHNSLPCFMLNKAHTRFLSRGKRCLRLSLGSLKAL